MARAAASMPAEGSTALKRQLALAVASAASSLPVPQPASNSVASFGSVCASVAVSSAWAN
ncbi:hypothetical protein [Serratia ureilytica]